MAFKSKHGAPMAWLREHVSYAGSDCLTWPFARSSRGYGNIRTGESHMVAHRAMAILAHGNPTFPEAQAAHICGKGHEGCVNPMHLEWKTPHANQADRIGHGTTIRGEMQHKSVLTEGQVLAIYRDTRKLKVIAKDYGCTPSNISQIRCGHRWAWLTSNHEARV